MELVRIKGMRKKNDEDERNEKKTWNRMIRLEDNKMRKNDKWGCKLRWKKMRTRKDEEDE